jgi:hypothetical protein
MESCRKDFGHPEKHTNKEPDNVAITWNGSRIGQCNLFRSIELLI